MSIQRALLAATFDGNARLRINDGTTAGNGTLGQCFASNTAGDSVWTGVISGKPTSATSPTLTAPATPGTYTCSLTRGGVESNLVTLVDMDLQPPTVTGISPAMGPTSSGTSVTITGTSFSGTTAVHFGTAAAASFTVNSATSITAVSAVSAVSASIGAVDVTVTTPAGTSATSTADQFTYTQAATAVTLTASPTSSTYGAAVMLTATVNNTAATGSVGFSNNGVTLGFSSVLGGVATLDATGIPVGSNSIVATYSGDSADLGSVSNAVIVTIDVPSTAVGSTSATQLVQFSFTSTVTLNATPATAVQVVTQGTLNLDFKYVSGGSCTAGVTYSSGDICTVKFSFTPAAPGQRLGAVVLDNNAATPVAAATTFISGLGSGPQALYTNGTQSTFYSNGTPKLNGLFVDANGDVYYTDDSTGKVYKIAAGTGTAITLASGLTFAGGVAVDGAGNVFYSDYGASKVYELVGGTGTGVVIATPANPEGGFAIDGAGNLYVPTSGSHVVQKYLAGSFAAFTTYGTGLTHPLGIGVDASGNVYIADYSGGKVVMVTADGSTQTTVASGLTSPAGVALDPAGNIYVGFDSGTAVTRYAASSYTPTLLAGAFSDPAYLALDGSGNLYVANRGVDVISEFARTAGTPLAFGSVAVGAASAATAVSLENDGNALLSVASIAPSSANFGFVGATEGSNAACGTPLAAAGVCGIAATFRPESVGALSASGVATDNSLNVNGATQTVALTGTGTQGTKTIAFAQPATPANLNSTATLTASTSDGDPVVFTISAGTATISGTTTTSGTTTATIVYTNSGSVTIAANSAATANATAAAEATQTVMVEAFPYVFVANGSGSVTSLSSMGAVTTGSTTGGGIGAAIDAAGDLWSIKTNGTSVTKFTDADAVSATYSGAGISAATALAIDGNGYVWIANSGSISALTNAGAAASTTAVAQAGNIKTPNSITVDSAGSLWVANTGNNTVTEVIGAAAPVTAPVVTQVINSTPGTKP